MTSTTLSSLVIILVAIVAAPILSDLAQRWVMIPSVVLEILLGVLIGPALGWAHVDATISLLSGFGLATLMFLAGLEVDVPRIKGSPLRRALAGYGLSLALGIAIGLALSPVDGTRSGLVVGLAITTTALGMLLPILRDGGELDTPFGTHVLAGATVGELGPIVAISLLFSTDRPGRTVAVMMLFVAVVLAAVWYAMRERTPRLARLLDETLMTSGQLAVRIVALMLVGMVWVADELGLDALLGAFSAGMVFRLFTSGADEREAELIEAKLHGLGFGFLVPVFFVVSGMRFDLDAIETTPLLLVAAIGFLLLFLVVRGLPSALLHHDMERRDRVAFALMLSTELPLVVVITTIGVETGRLSSGTSAALVTAAMLSSMIYPVVAGRVRAGGGAAA